MLRAVSTVYIESQALARRDVLKLFRWSARFSSAPAEQIVLTSDAARASGAGPAAPSGPAGLARAAASAPAPPERPHRPGGPSEPGEPGAPPPPGSRRSWTAVAALALTASLGGVYFYRKLNDDAPEQILKSDDTQKESGAAEGSAAWEPMPVPPPLPVPVPVPVPARADQLPGHVQYLLVGGGTASFAAMRAIRSARPDAQVLIVGEEHALPYMRPPLSKEVWREPDLAERAAHPDRLTFRQWNGKRRSVTYEPGAFYAATERLRAGGGGAGGAGAARGWRVTRLRPERHEAELSAPGAPGAGTATLTYDKCLVATGARARRLGALRGAARAGRALALRDVRDAQRLAAAVDAPATRAVLVVGGGFLGTELAAALADRLRDTGKTVTQVYREEVPMAGVLPHYLAADLARRTARDGVVLLPNTEIIDSEVREGRVRLRARKPREANGEGEDESVAEREERELEADVVVECVGCEPDTELALASGLELHPDLGGLVVNAELQARTDVWAAGDAACFHDVALGRRRVEHHDHAVVSGRLAGENMAALHPPEPYEHQSMFWSDLGPHLGYEAIGIIDSRLPTVGFFSEDAVKDAESAPPSDRRPLSAEAASPSPAPAPAPAPASPAPAPAAPSGDPSTRQYERGVVFYLRDERVVGVLLWNLFNRMPVARQVLSHGKFDDLFEVAKLFAPHED